MHGISHKCNRHLSHVWRLTGQWRANPFSRKQAVQLESYSISGGYPFYSDQSSLVYSGGYPCIDRVLG
ncbi:MAG TPA: hypothetical protein DCL07_05300 [Cryomorphaceae bacterium]|nr:hypothetical protein [Cryomorphaceae bacterium]HAG49332.1 hypothetical protein [Cryomorphaceae bacterium]